MKPSALIVVLIFLVGGAAWFWMSRSAPVSQLTTTDYKNLIYTIEGQTAKYFGNDATGDLNGDGLPDAAFIVTQSGGGSGTFYYVVVALKTRDGYQGTNAILLGDRIAPQTTEIKNGQVIVNYADRKLSEPMTTKPSVGVSKYLTVEGATLVDASAR